MTDDEAKAIGLRAVACDGWRWLPGMLTNGGGRLLRVCSFDAKFVVAHYPHSTLSPFPSTGLTPDFRDPATLGCLLVLVRELSGDCRAHLAPNGASWRLCVGCWWFVEPTEAEALVAALEAA